MNNSFKSSLAGTLIMVCSLFQVQAQIEVRLSIKVILDANGMRPTGGVLSTDDGIRNGVANANKSMASFGRGYQYRITEITNLPGHANLLDLTCQDASDFIDAVVQTNAVSYQWRTNAANVYVNKGADDISCAYNSLLVLKYSSSAFLHEGGHHLGLAHTQGDGCKDCDTCTNLMSDFINDTLPDRECWSSNQIASYSFPNYPNLTPAQVTMVSNTFNNVMAYHGSDGGSQRVLTPDQWDRIADYTRTNRTNIMNGKTLFVDRDNTCTGRTGSSACTTSGTAGPFQTVTVGVSTASAGDIVLIRPGHYNESMTISKAVTLRATRGDALVGTP